MRFREFKQPQPQQQPQQPQQTQQQQQQHLGLLDTGATTITTRVYVLEIVTRLLWRR